jgi:hypothetical protein
LDDVRITYIGGPTILLDVGGKDSSDDPIYISGDAVWYEGVEETLERFPNIHVAVLFVGTARIPVLPANLTFSAAEAVRVAEALPAGQDRTSSFRRMETSDGIQRRLDEHVYGGGAQGSVAVVTGRQNGLSFAIHT